MNSIVIEDGAGAIFNETNRRNDRGAAANRAVPPGAALNFVSEEGLGAIFNETKRRNDRGKAANRAAPPGAALNFVIEEGAGAPPRWFGLSFP